MLDYPFHDWLPVVFVALMGISILVYVVLDGFDLGVGILSMSAEDQHRDIMIGSIGPFWDANETWLVMAVGILLVAFPPAHGEILVALYLPATLMLIGLILRGVAFEFRAKVNLDRKIWWDRAFFAGSLLAAVMQGYMLGKFVTGFATGPLAVAFAMLTGLCLAAGYAFIGACWLIGKTEGALQRRSVDLAKRLVWFAALGMIAISIVSPLANPEVFARWFALPEIILLAPVPLMAAGLFVMLLLLLREMPIPGDRWAWAPFAMTVALYVLAFAGLAYSFFPYVVPGEMTVWDAAASRESLAIILVGACITLPVIAGYSIWAYFIFRGKATALRYE
ncbi:MAG: cytochrome d ubiquinol oxidase subunit II [Rubricella sp.]